MTSTTFTPETLREMAGRGDVAVVIGDETYPTLAAAVAEVDAIHARSQQIAVESMRQYRGARERTAEHKALCFAPAREAERVANEARNIVCRAYGIPEWSVV